MWPSGLPTRGIANPDWDNVTTLAGMSPDEGALCAATWANGVAPSQVALAWLLWRSPVMLPIPGTSSVEHLEENVAAAAIELDEAELEELSGLSS